MVTIQEAILQGWREGKVRTLDTLEYALSLSTITKSMVSTFIRVLESNYSDCGEYLLRVWTSKYSQK